MCAPRASASTSSGCAYSRSIRSRTRRSRARSRRCSAAAGVPVTCEIMAPRAGVAGVRPRTVSARAQSAADVGREVLGGEGGAGGDEVGGCALEDDPAAVVAGAGAEVDDPVGVRHDRLVVLDDDDRLAGVDEPVEQAEQLLDVGEMEAAGRLVENVDAALLPQVGGQLESLPLAAGQRRERLADGEVAQADVGEPVEDLVRR